MTTRCHTFTGQGFDPFNPRPEDVDIEDIAHHLAMTCRFGGAAPTYYSVAQHATRVARLVLEETQNPMWALWALHHDDAEAYIHDIRRPIKKAIAIIDASDVFSFDDFEERVFGEIVCGLNLPALGESMQECAELVKAADDAVLRAEMRCFFNDEPGTSVRSTLVAPILRREQCMDWCSAKGLFLSLHRNLSRDVLRLQDAARVARRAAEERDA